MLAFLRCVLCCECDDEPNTGGYNSESYYNGSRSQSYDSHVISNSSGTFSRTTFPDPIMSTQTVPTTQSQNYSTFNIPQKSSTPSVSNQPNRTLPRIHAKFISRVNPTKTPDIPTATHTNVFPKSTSSCSYSLLSSPPSPKLGSSFASSSTSPKLVSTKPNRTLRRIHAKFISEVNPTKTPDIPAATHTNVFPKSTSSCSYSLLSSPPSPKLGSSFASSSSSPKLVSTKPILKRAVSIPTSNQTSQCNVVEKGLTPLHVILEEDTDSIRKDAVPGVLQKPVSPQTYQDCRAALLDAEDSYLKVPAKRSLADYLRESGPRLVSLYGSTELYPTDEARCIIQGMVTAILNLKKDRRKHNYLKNPENLILEDKGCHPYSSYVRDLAAGHVLRNRKILEQAGKGYPTSIEVTLEKNRMDLESDDLAALKYLIFDVILVLDDDKKPQLPAEWKSFKKLFLKTELDYAILSSHPCLWGYTKRLGFYFALDKWCSPYKSEEAVRDIVIDNLRSVHILKTNWTKKMKRDDHLREFTATMTPSRQHEVYGLIRFFRNLVEHCQDKASASSPYKEERYLDYKLRNIYPNLLEELHKKLLLAGFVY